MDRQRRGKDRQSPATADQGVSLTRRSARSLLMEAVSKEAVTLSGSTHDI